MEKQNQRERWLRAVRAAFPATVPVMTGYLVLGLAYSVLMTTQGYGFPWPLLTSIFVFAGSMQFVGLSLLAAPFDFWQAFFLSVMVNARHMFYGISLLEKYKGTGKARFPMIYLLCDETFSLVSVLEPPEGVARKDYYLCISLLDYSYWLVGTTIGCIASNFVNFDTTGLDFALTALIVVLFLEQWKKVENRIASVIGVVCTALCLALFGAENLVIAAMVMILAVLMGGSDRLCN